jgi:SAM-dependent methyltransferase
MTSNTYSNLYQSAAASGGWAHIEQEENTDWGSVYDIVIPQLSPSSHVLDIGTADGIRFLQLAPFIGAGIGIDYEQSMVELAMRNAAAAGISSIEFLQMDSEFLTLEPDSFDVITARHAPVYMQELFRVLKPGGRVYIQAVCEIDKLNLKTAFGRGQDFGIANGARMNRYVTAAHEAGFSSVSSQVSDRPHYFASRDAVLKYLQSTPSVADFGSKESDQQTLDVYCQEHMTEKGITSNTARFYLEIVK